MSDLVDTLHAFASLFEGLTIPYAIMGGWAVRVYAIPRPTFDVDFTIVIDRDRLPVLYAAAEHAGFTVPEQYRNGWVDSVAGMPLVKFRLDLGNQGFDIDDPLLARSELDAPYLRRWAGPLGVESKLDEVLASRE